MGCELIRRALGKGKRVLEIVHRRRLVDQFSDRLIEFQVDHGICMRGHRMEHNARVQVASRDTLLSAEYALPQADLVLVDEGRHAASPEFRKLLRPYEQAGAFIVLLDATPVMPDGGGMGPWAQALVQAAKVSELVKDGYLCPVKCFRPETKMRNGKPRRGIAGELVSSWQAFAQNMPTVLFCSRVQHSRNAVQSFIQEGIPAAHVDAETDENERDRIFEGLETGKYKVVSNVGIIKEGVDIPCLGCCQFFMEVNGRVQWIQGAGRIMRKFPGKDHGIIIDHPGAVWKFGFPDEDTEWKLEGNVDQDFEKKREEGLTEKVLYCKVCELAYKDSLNCPQCGRLPSKPPKSIFAPKEQDATHEILTEAERGQRVECDREEKISHWFRCLQVAKKRGSNFLMASSIFKQRYRHFPPDDFPMMPDWSQRRHRIEDVYPDFGRRTHGGNR